MKILYKITFNNSKGLSINCYLVKENEYLTFMIYQWNNMLKYIILKHAYHDTKRQLIPKMINAILRLKLYYYRNKIEEKATFRSIH